MKKIIFKETVNPDFDFLYEDDGLKEISGKNNTLYVIAAGGYCPVNAKEYEKICSIAEDIANEFTDLMNGDNYYFKSFKEILNYYGVRYTPAIVNKLKVYAAHYTGDYEDIAEYLTITTGEKWNTYGVTGYCQGDYAIGIYCEGHYTLAALDLYVGAAAGTVSEFMRIEGEDTCYGFFVPDTVKWNTEDLRRYLCDIWGDKPEEVSIELFEGYTQIASYKTI